MKTPISNKRSQAAMEFLLTYGWAILVVLVVIGALAYFGILNPAALLPEKCLFGPGIGRCNDFAAYTGVMDTSLVWIYLTNNIGQPIGSIRVTTDGDLGDCHKQGAIGVLKEGWTPTTLSGPINAFLSSGDVSQVHDMITIIPVIDQDNLCNILDCKTWNEGEKVSLVLYTCDDLPEKERITQTITIEYTYAGSSLVHAVTGDISTTLQENPWGP